MNIFLDLPLSFQICQPVPVLKFIRYRFCNAGAAGLIQSAGHMLSGLLGKFGPTDDVLPEFVPQSIHRFIQLQLPLILLRTHAGEEIILLVRLPGQMGHLDPQLPQGCHPIPGLVKHTAGLPEDLLRQIGGTVKLCLV